MENIEKESAMIKDEENEEFFDAIETTTTTKQKNDLYKNLDNNEHISHKHKCEHIDDDEDEESEELRKVMHRRLNINDDKNEENKQFKPLHERLNEGLKISDDSVKPETDTSEENFDPPIKSDEPFQDPYYINEELLKKQETELNVEQLAQRHNESIELKDEGNKLFKEANYQSAMDVYTRALKLCPFIENKDRAILYSNRSICYLKLQDTNRCIIDCTSSIELDPKYLKPLIRRAECYENLDKLDEAFNDYKKLAELEPKNYSYKSKCYQLERAIHERNEKLKTEMMGKLKDLGNMILKPFGLSTNNFNLVQDPNSGSYSINFNQNPS